MPKEQPVEGQIQDRSQDTTAQNAPENLESAASPTAQPDNSELISTKAQLERMKEDLERERETARLLQTYVATQQQQQQQRRTPEDDEFKDVEKVLGPYFDKKVRPYIDQVSKVLTDHFDRLDRLEFVRELIDADPDLSERLNPGIPMDEIDQYRMRVAQMEGRYISRSNALGILRGMRAIREDKKSKLTKKQQAKTDDVVRQAAVDAAQSGEDKPAAPVSNNANSALVKLRAGGKLTDEERKKARESLGDVSF